MEVIFEILLLCIGGYWCTTALTTLPLWKNGSIAGGLLPAFASGVMCILLLIRIITSIKNGELKKENFEKSLKEFDVKAFVPVLIGILVVVGIKTLGMLITLAIVLFVWLKFISKATWLQSILITVITMAVVYGIFKMWLVVPFPKGMLKLI